MKNTTILILLITIIIVHHFYIDLVLMYNGDYNYYYLKLLINNYMY
jgi:hypothetical protein